MWIFCKITSGMGSRRTHPNRGFSGWWVTNCYPFLWAGQPIPGTQTWKWRRHHGTWPGCPCAEQTTLVCKEDPSPAFLPSDHTSLLSYSPSVGAPHPPGQAPLISWLSDQPRVPLSWVLCFDSAHECIGFCHSWLIRLIATWSPHKAFRHPAAATLLVLFFFSLVHSLKLSKSLKIWIYHLAYSVTLPGSHELTLSILTQTFNNNVWQMGPNAGLPTLGPLHTEQLLWAQSCTDKKLICLSCHSVHVLHLSKRTSWETFSDVLLKPRYTASAVFPQGKD